MKHVFNDENMNDAGNARFLCEVEGDNIRYSFVNKQWYVWNGKLWKPDVDGQIRRKCDQAIKLMRQKAENEILDDKQRFRVVKYINQLGNINRRHKMLESAQHLEGIAITPDKLESNPMILNCQNGIFDLRTFALSSHDKFQFITQICPVKYDPNATCPQWLDFINEIMGGEQEVIDYLQAAVGYTLTGIVNERCMFVLIGDGANGKSTFLEVIRKLLGTYAGNAEAETLMVRRGRTGSASPDMARLKGLRFVSTIETDEDAQLNVAHIKHITGEDTITCRRLYENEIEYKPDFKIWLGTNHFESMSICWTQKLIIFLNSSSGIILFHM